MSSGYQDDIGKKHFYKNIQSEDIGKQYLQKYTFCIMVADTRGILESTNIYKNTFLMSSGYQDDIGKKYMYRNIQSEDIGKKVFTKIHILYDCGILRGYWRQRKIFTKTDILFNSRLYFV